MNHSYKRSRAQKNIANLLILFFFICTSTTIKPMETLLELLQVLDYGPLDDPRLSQEEAEGYRKKACLTLLYHAIKNGEMQETASHLPLYLAENTEPLVIQIPDTAQNIWQRVFHPHSIDLELAPLHIATKNNQPTIVQFLLANGIPIDSKDAEGNTCLHIATFYNYEHIARVLIENNADVEAINNEGKRPIHLAAQQGFLNIIELLLIKHANIDSCDREGLTAISLAHNNEHQHMLPRLHELQEKNLLRTLPHLPKCLATPPAQLLGLILTQNILHKHNLYRTIKELISDGVDCNTLYDGSNTPLHYAIINHHTMLALYLLGHGADPAITNNESDSPIHLAVKHNLSMLSRLGFLGSSVQRYSYLTGYYTIPIFHLRTEEQIAIARKKWITQWHTIVQ